MILTIQHQGNENGYNKFTGKKRDDVLGMDHFFARDYLPQTGRFNGSDPIMEYSNPYSYVANRPLNFADPLGMQRNNGRRDDQGSPMHWGFLARGGVMGTSYYVDGVEVTGDFFYDAAGVENSSELVYKYSYRRVKKTRWVPLPRGYKTNIDSEWDIIPELIEVEATPLVEETYWEWVDTGDKLDPFTLNKNIFNMHYPGPNNPKKYNGDPDYSTQPVNVAGYPALIHDKAYDGLEISGANDMFFNTSAIPADLKFVAEELIISYLLRSLNPITSFKAGIIGIFSGAAIAPKTILFFYRIRIR